MRLSLLSSIALVALTGAGCNNSEPEDPAAGAAVAKETWQQSALPYDLNKPVLQVELPAVLEEISGLSYVAPNLLACVQDENGKIFHVDLTRSQVVAEYEFGKDGDYEGLEIQGDTCWILRSDGDLYEISNYTQADFKKEKFENVLTDDNNAEGLGYDAKENRLLVACKGDPGKGDPGKGGEYKGTKSIYAFDLGSKSLQELPLYAIRSDDLAHALESEPAENASPEDSESAGESISFKPSGVAVHPMTGEIYVLASVGKLLVTLDSKGELIRVNRLPEEYFPHPEGICFSPSGDLFVSNEGVGGVAKILKFQFVGE